MGDGNESANQDKFDLRLNKPAGQFAKILQAPSTWPIPKRKASSFASIRSHTVFARLSSSDGRSMPLSDTAGSSGIPWESARAFWEN